MRHKKTHCLVIEEEPYNWSGPKSFKHHRLTEVSFLILVAGLLSSLIRRQKNNRTQSARLQDRRKIEGLLAAPNRELDLISRCGSAQHVGIGLQTAQGLSVELQNHISGL